MSSPVSCPSDVGIGKWQTSINGLFVLNGIDVGYHLLKRLISVHFFTCVLFNYKGERNFKGMHAAIL